VVVPGRNTQQGLVLVQKIGCSLKVGEEIWGNFQVILQEDDILQSLTFEEKLQGNNDTTTTTARSSIHPSTHPHKAHTKMAASKMRTSYMTAESPTTTTTILGSRADTAVGHLVGN
jgi:hypothetical protein